VYLLPGLLLLILRFKMMEVKSRCEVGQAMPDGVAPPTMAASMHLTFFGFNLLIIKGI
jgi:hypothetical protein